MVFVTDVYADPYVEQNPFSAFSPPVVNRGAFTRDSRLWSFECLASFCGTSEKLSTLPP